MAVCGYIREAEEAEEADEAEGAAKSYLKA
jgi:hypothetical protein